MSASETVGQTIPVTIAFLDQFGHPLATTPTPDSPPIWTLDGAPATNAAPATSAVGTLTPSTDGLSATYKGLAAGTDTIAVSVLVGGATFSASATITVSEPASVLTSIALVFGTPA